MEKKEETFQEVVKNILRGGKNAMEISDSDAISITRLSRIEEGCTFARFLRQEGEWARKSAVDTMGDERWNAFCQGMEAAYCELADKLDKLKNA